MHPYSVRFLKPAGAALVALGALIMLKAVWPTASHLSLSMLVAVALSFGLYGLVLFLLGLNPEDKYILLQIKQRFGGKVGNAQP